ncbi:MAG: SIMPL domain-containing protein [Myxococcales bacterium]|nr:SIMPL domain-containing protein [Myxococcales bacterium]
MWVPFSVLGVSVVCAAWLIAEGFVAGRRAERTVTVKGLAERDVEADLALWSISFVATGDDLSRVQQQLEYDEASVRSFLSRRNMVGDAVSTQALEVTDRHAQTYGSGPVTSRYIVRKTLLVRTSDVDAVVDASQHLDELLREGVVLGSDRGPMESRPAFLFTRLGDIKPAMLREATHSARTAAEQFSADSETRVGTLLEAQQGLFQILARDDAPQLMEAHQRSKTVRVVSTLTFALE